MNLHLRLYTEGTEDAIGVSDVDTTVDMQVIGVISLVAKTKHP